MTTKIKRRRSKISEADGIFSIIIPVDKNRLIIPLLIIWIIWFYVGLNNKFMELLWGRMDPFQKYITHVFWIILGIVIGIQLIFFFCWGYFGKERIVIENGICYLTKTIKNFGIHHNLEISLIQNIRIEKNETSPFSGISFRLWGLGPGKIKMDYGDRTFSFGIEIDETEAEYLFDLLKTKIK